MTTTRSHRDRSVVMARLPLASGRRQIRFVIAIALIAAAVSMSAVLFHPEAIHLRRDQSAAARPTGNEQSPETLRAPSAEGYAVLDRIVDGAYAVLLVGDAEDEAHFSLEALAPGLREGTWYRVEGPLGKGLFLTPDHERSQIMRRRIEKKLELLRSRCSRC